MKWAPGLCGFGKAGLRGINGHIEQAITSKLHCWVPGYIQWFYPVGRYQLFLQISLSIYIFHLPFFLAGHKIDVTIQCDFMRFHLVILNDIIWGQEKMGYVTLVDISGSTIHLSWYPFLKSCHCNTLKDWAPDDVIGGCSIIKWVPETSLLDRLPGKYFQKWLLGNESL